MKSLLLLRHANSPNFQTALRDFDRPLSNLGRQTAEMVGNYISSTELWPDLVVSSPAVRARETTEAVLSSAGNRCEVRYDQRVYDATVHDLLSVISGVEPHRENVLIVGHNPGLEELINTLAARQHALGPANLARMNLEISEWSEVEAEKCALAWIVTPAELKQSK